jgi:transcriptional repressor NrdR
MRSTHLGRFCFKDTYPITIANINIDALTSVSGMMIVVTLNVESEGETLPRAPITRSLFFMRCPDCEYIDSKVIESRDLEEGSSIRRRRQCLSCGFRFTTYERVESPRLSIIKKDGRREPFDRDKIAGGIYRACEKRPIPVSRVEEVIGDIERELRALGEPEVEVGRVGEIVMRQLLALDDVAYVRFASVYRSFTDVESFEAELARLKTRTVRS